MLGQKGKRLGGYVRDYVVFDLETTGVSPVTDRIVELSAIRVEAGNTVREYSSLVNPHMPIPFQASQVNGITDEMVAGAPDIEKVLGEFLDLIGDLPLVGHNIHTFDMKFLWRESERIYGSLVANDYVDTLSMARTYLPELGRYKLVDLAAYYGLSCEGAHRALADCRMDQEVFERLGREKPKDVLLCPRCQSPLVKRKGRYGAFWGCTAYPDCRYTKNIP